VEDGGRSVAVAGPCSAEVDLDGIKKSEDRGPMEMIVGRERCVDEEFVEENGTRGGGGKQGEVGEAEVLCEQANGVGEEKRTDTIVGVWDFVDNLPRKECKGNE